MRVALCTDGIHPQALGGMQRHSRLLAEHLARNGSVKLIVLHPHGERVFDPALGIEEVQVEDIDRRKFYLRELWRYSGRIAKELDGLTPDVILSQGFCVWKGMDRFSDRLILHPHGLEMFQMPAFKERLSGWPFRMALRHMARKSAVVISLGGRLTDILRQQVNESNSRVVVIPNAVDLPSPHTAHLAPHTAPVTLLFVGRFAFNKGLDVLMAAAQRLVRENKGGVVRFLLAGDGPLLERHQAAGLPPNVDLLGRVDDERLTTLYRECDALVLPTRFEGMPTVVLEAMAAGKPILVSDVGATAELVDMHNGYLLPPGDGDALYDAILSFAERSRELHRTMGEVSYDRVKERFSWPVVTRQFEALFAQIRPASPGPGAR